MKRLINILLLLAVPALAEVDTRPPAAAVAHGAGTVQTALDAWDAAAGVQLADLVPGDRIPGIVSNYYGSLILSLLRPLLASYTYAFTTNSIAFGPGTTLTVDNLATRHIIAQKVDASRLTVTGVLSAATAFLDFPGVAPAGIHATAATVSRGRLQSGSTWATNASMVVLRTLALGVDSFPSGNRTAFPDGFTVRGDVYLYSDDTLSEQYSREVVRMTVETGAVSYAYNPTYVVPTAAGPTLTAGRYRAEYKAGSSVLATVGLDTTRDIPIAGLGPRGLIDSTFAGTGASPAVLTGLVSYTVGVYLSALYSKPVAFNFTRMPVPPLPPLPDPSQWWTVGVVVTPPPDEDEKPGSDLPAGCPDTPEPEPDDPVRCYTPAPDQQFIPDPPLVMSEITAFSTNGNGSMTLAAETTTQGPGESRSDFKGRARLSAERIGDVYKAATPHGPVYSRVLVPGRLLWQDFATINTGHWYVNIHHAVYMTRLATSVVIGDYRQRSVLTLDNAEWWYILMGYPWDSADASCAASWRFESGVNPATYGIGNVLYAVGNTVYWISDIVGADGYYGATTVVTLNHETGVIEFDTTYGTGLDNMGLPPELAEQMIVRDWLGDAVARRNYNSTMATSPSGDHALTGSGVYDLGVRSADGSKPGYVYGASGMTIVADSSGKKIQDSEGGGYYLVTTTPRLDGTLEVAVHGSGGPSVPIRRDITSVTATRGVNEDGQPGVWWTFHHKPRCR